MFEGGNDGGPRGLESARADDGGPALVPVPPVEVRSNRDKWEGRQVDVQWGCVWEVRVGRDEPQAISEEGRGGLQPRCIGLTLRSVSIDIAAGGADC